VRLLLISHAAGTAAGLSEGARARAADIGRALPRPRAAFTSPAPEAVQTSEALGLIATIDPELRDDGDDVAARAQRWLDRHRRHSGTIAAVTHAAVIRAAVAVALGTPVANARAVDIAPCSVTELSFRDDHWQLAHVNWEPALLHIPQRRGRRRPRRPASDQPPHAENRE
jgi:broad specificity phosphatase PhoE